MINVAVRFRQILILMLETESYISVKSLAEELNVSKRTIQRELEGVDDALKGYQLAFRSKTGVGVWLEGERAEKERLLADLRQEAGYDLSNKQERRKKLILEILREKGLRKLFHYSDLLGVSEATVSTDLEAVENWLKEQDLHIIRKPGSGIAIKGSEESYRRAIRLFVAENIDTKLIKNLYDHELSSSESLNSLKQSNIGHILNDEIVKRVVDCISKMNDERVLSLTENSYVGLVIHISIAINRILQEDIIEEAQVWTDQMEEDEEYLLAKEIIKELEKEFAIKIPEIEISYICLHIKGSKHQSIEWNQKKLPEIEKKEMLSLVNEMVNAFGEEKAFTLKQDDEFIQGLLAHLQPTLVRLMHHMKIQNPVLEEIKKEYREVFERCKEVAKVLERWTNQSVPEAEVGYLAIHFGAAMVRLEGENESIRPVVVGVVCAGGFGISRLMASKLEKTFRNRVVIEAYGKHDLTPEVKSKTDFFVNSISTEQGDEQMISVSPLLNKEDMEKIAQAVHHYERLPRKEKKESGFTLQLEQINYLANMIKTIIRQMEFFNVNSDITFEELVFVAAQRLSPHPDKRRLVIEDILRREKLGTQVFAEFGFALLHTKTQGVVNPSFTVCMTEGLDVFKNSYFKEIQVVLIMLMPDDENRVVNRQMFGHLSSTLIAEYDFLATIMKGDKEEIQEILSKYLKQFFNEYLNKLE